MPVSFESDRFLSLDLCVDFRYRLADPRGTGLKLSALLAAGYKRGIRSSTSSHKEASKQRSRSGGRPGNCPGGRVSYIWVLCLVRVSGCMPP